MRQPNRDALTGSDRYFPKETLLKPLTTEKLKLHFFIGETLMSHCQLGSHCTELQVALYL